MTIPSSSPASSRAASAPWRPISWRRYWSASRRRCAELLLCTSVLERVSGPLADYLTGGSGAERILQELEDANAFVSSVDAGRSWFRYHHLFADLLRLELRRTFPEMVGQLHRAASDWFEQEGYAVEAVRHAQLARDWPHATRLLVDSRIGLILDGRLATLRALLDDFPASRCRC